MGQSRISASLALLKREAIARNRRVGKNIFYAVRPEIVSPLRSILEAARRELPEAAERQRCHGSGVAQAQRQSGRVF